MSLSCFFFNDTAPTEIYTLSLHDALPILLDYIARHRKQIVQAERYPDVRRRSVIELAERSNYWPEHASQISKLATSDRKSTRLNSSHSQISYAVFCLKKKKKKKIHNK